MKNSDNESTPREEDSRDRAPLVEPAAVAPASAATERMKPAVADGSFGVIALVVMNVLSSVSIVSVNKILVQTYQFQFILLLTCAHFLAGFAFLHLASSDAIAMFKRATAPRGAILNIAIAGMVSIVLMNYSLRYNSMGTYQILKVAVLPVTMALSHFSGTGAPTTLQEVYAAGLVVVGTLICTVSDVSMTLVGIALGLAAVVATAQYQIYQGSIQKQCGITSTQALHLMSLPQAGLALLASLVLETDWISRFVPPGQRLQGGAAEAAPAVVVIKDIWSHDYTSGEIGIILATCVFAVLLNYSTIGVIGKTSAVAMQFVNQLKTVLVVTMSFVLFPNAEMTLARVGGLVAGLACVFSGVAWYTVLRQQQQQPASK